MNIHWKDGSWSSVLDAKSWLLDTGKRPSAAGRLGRQEESLMAGMRWHHWLDAQEFEQLQEEGQRSLAFCPRICKMWTVGHNLATEQQSFASSPLSYINTSSTLFSPSRLHVVRISALPFTITHLPNAGFSKSLGRSQLFRIRISLFYLKIIGLRSLSCRSFPH